MIDLIAATVTQIAHNVYARLDPYAGGVADLEHVRLAADSARRQMHLSELAVVEGVVQAAAREQLGVAALLDDAPVRP